jgi:hypothetical protein
MMSKDKVQWEGGDSIYGGGGWKIGKIKKGLYSAILLLNINLIPTLSKKTHSSNLKIKRNFVIIFTFRSI